MMRLLIFYVVVLVVSSELLGGINGQKEFNYCCLDCDPPATTHIMCKDEVPEPPGECVASADKYIGLANKIALESWVSQSKQQEKKNKTKPDDGAREDVAGANSDLYLTEHDLVNYDYFLDRINDKRRDWVNEVQISDMQELYWDDELADIATAIARMCNSFQSYCSDTATYRVQELRYNITLPRNETIETEIVEHWMRGKEEFKKTNGNNTIYEESRESTNTFVLLMWATLSRMGCSGASNQGKNGTFQITCLFSPAGLVVGAPMWTKGKPCSECNSYERCGRHAALCSEIEERFEFHPDVNRTLRCDFSNSSDWYDPYKSVPLLEREFDFDTGVKVILKPRKICDPITSSGDNMMGQYSLVVATAVLLWVKGQRKPESNWLRYLQLEI